VVRRAALTQLGRAEIERLRSLPLSYPDDDGGTPAGYWPYTVSAVIGRGRATYERAVAQTLAWEIHLRSGIGVRSSAEKIVMEPMTVARIAIPVSFLRFTGYARVVEVIDEPDRGGFVYGTLPGHPESGAEAFVVTIDADDVVRLTISAYSRPASWYARLGGPVTRMLQMRMARRFLRVLAV
jgi:uncharacterized protein (UPF0548 family)